MSRAIDLCGQRFARLTVKSQGPSANGQSRWNCVCDCGNETLVYRTSLVQKTTNSCGCFNKETASTRTALDLTGQVFGRLKVLGRGSKEGKGAAKGSFWDCLCECGTRKIINAGNLVQKNTKSCGCLAVETATKHGHNKDKGRRTRTYAIWTGMMSRCRNERVKCFHRYGAAGITVDPRWDDFANFLADMGEAPAGLTLDREDNSKGYSKDNCRWATTKAQGRNTKRNVPLTINGVTACLADWSESLGINYMRLYMAHRKLGNNWPAIAARMRISEHVEGTPANPMSAGTLAQVEALQ